MRAPVNHNQGSPRIRVHGQGCGATGAAASTPRPAPARPQPRSRAGYVGLGSSHSRPTPTPTPGPCRGKVRAGAPSSPSQVSLLFPGADELLKRWHFASSPALRPALAPHLASLLPLIQDEVQRSRQAGAGGASSLACVHTHRPSHTHMHSHMLTSSGIPQPRALVGGVDLSRTDLGQVATSVKRSWVGATHSRGSLRPTSLGTWWARPSGLPAHLLTPGCGWVEVAPHLSVKPGGADCPPTRTHRTSPTPASASSLPNLRSQFYFLSLRPSRWFCGTERSAAPLEKVGVRNNNNNFKDSSCS